ncbi:MAG: hypothetical protein RMA76_15595 [Deltaproteobacteria bacterium]|jgi:alpha-tubulin suppressor-like RCC1 family protein
MMRGRTSLLLLVGAVACGDDPATECTPNATQFCTCPHEDGRILGEETCSAEGAWGECSCVVPRDGGPPPAPRDGGRVRDAGTRDGGVPLSCTPLMTRPVTECAIVDLVAGSTHTCVLRAAGEVNCFGVDDDGRLGRDGVAAPSAWTRDDLLPVPGLAATSIAARNDYTCAIDEAGAAWCFGSNAFGKLGTGTTAEDLANIDRPTRVVQVRAALQLALGANHACARDPGGLSCWGSNEHGQLGRNVDGTALPEDPTPMKLEPLGPVVDVAAGDGFTCAINASGRIVCFGRNDEGQLGDGTMNPNNASVPSLIPGERTGSAVAAGRRHTCAILDDTTVWCWGNNAAGQLALELRTERSTTPQRVDITFDAPLDRAVAIRAAGDQTCVRRDDDTVVCWGAASTFCDPDGGGITVAPRSVGWFGPYARAVGVGDGHVCALRRDRLVQCIGANLGGQSAPEAPDASCEHDDPIAILP